MAARTTITDAIKAAIEAYPESRNELCRRADIDPAALSRFMTDKKTMNLPTLEKLAPVLGLELTARKSHTQEKRRG